MDDSSEHHDELKHEKLIRVRRAKKHKHTSKKKKPWYRSSQVRGSIEILAKIVGLLLVVTGIVMAVWLVFFNAPS